MVRSSHSNRLDEPDKINVTHRDGNRAACLTTRTMPTPEQLRLQAEAVAKVRAARVQRDRAVEHATQQFKTAILAAVSSGAAVRDIAIAADMSPQRIYQIIRGDGRPQRPA